ncbi:hypothetical protein [Paenibacillus periandrae]|uniref:hypothetical protein n=1 Tax=Paenibacillus periandrae TaxID=1761741 RepID=UPI001F08E1CE|nr:hypothetical protein [Paenibacillus periandrae]
MQIDKEKLLEWLSIKEKDSMTNAENLLNSSMYHGQASAFSDVIEQIELGTFDIEEES